MRKQTKIAAVVSAAALLALGASMTSFAASKGTWMMVDGEWYCYDSNGDVYENTFCSSNGKEYYVGDDGQLVRSSWVEYDGDYYFVNSSGQKITNDWRLTSPYDDEDAEEEWFYFQSTGKRAENKKILYKGSTYFFDADGEMLTGWVTYDGSGTASVDEANDFDEDKTFYCDETGARVQTNWVYSTKPGVEDDDADADEYWYWMKSSGKAQTGKATNIKGQVYLFDENGQLQTGWVAKNSDGNYMEIGDEDSTYKISQFADVYYCPYEEDGDYDGHAKKNQWIKTWRPSDYDEEDEDNDKWWYWLQKDGKLYIPSYSDATVYRYKLTDAALEVKNSGYSFDIAKKKVNSKDYFFNMNGEMATDFIQVIAIDPDSNCDLMKGMYYFGGSNDGSMKTGSQSVKDDNGDTYKFYFGTKSTNNYEKKGLGITGNKSNKVYYMGLLMTADDYKYQMVTIPNPDVKAVAEGKQEETYTFIVNKNGSIQHSQVEYKEDGDVLIDTTATDKEGKKVVKFNAAPDQWKYSITADSLGSVVNNVEKIDITDVMDTVK